MEDQAGHTQQRETPLSWYLKAKFGLFIHWGAYAVAGVEASWPIMTPDLAVAMFGNKTRISQAEYTSLPGRFNPIDFDAEAWVQMAQATGMRYIIFTSKHHDGFCMFDAPGTDYKITNTPYRKDICLELAQACAKAGMPLGFYYSPPDMHHPGYRDTSKPAAQNWLGEPKRKEWRDYLDTMESHLRKLLTDYGKVSILWFDGLVNHAKYDPPRFHKLIHELSPDTLINDRLGNGYDFITPEQFIPKLGIPVRCGKPPAGNDPAGEKLFRSVTLLSKVPGLRRFIYKQLQKYSVGKLELTPVLQEPYPSPERFQPWETCMTMGRSWAYNPNEDSWKSPHQLVHNMVEVISRGGNYLLNAGPTAQGSFPPETTERLEVVGRWVKTYTEAIYGSTYTSMQGLPWVRITREEDKLYFFVLEWPPNHKLVIKDFSIDLQSITLFSGEPVAFTLSGQCLEINLPAQASDPVVSVLVGKTHP
jgi:alpha-L-fucosidase